MTNIKDKQLFHWDSICCTFPFYTVKNFILGFLLLIFCCCFFDTSMMEKILGPNKHFQLLHCPNSNNNDTESNYMVPPIDQMNYFFLLTNTILLEQVRSHNGPSGSHTLPIYIIWAHNIAFSSLTHSFPLLPFSTPEKIRKPYGFLMFSGGRGRVHWERMGQYFT